MLRSLIHTCVRRRIPVLVLTLAVAAFGVRAYLATPVEAFPDVTNLQVTVIAQLAGMAPEEIEPQVTVPLERVLNGTPGMLMMRSESLFAVCSIAPDELPRHLPPRPTRATSPSRNCISKSAAT